MRPHLETLAVATPGPGLTDITREVADVVRASTIREGQVTLFIRHTSASLVIQENADPDVLHDLQTFFARIAPQTDTYRHATEGPDDMPAHIKSALTATSLTVPVSNGNMLLGTWQGIYVFEHRARQHTRSVVVQVVGA
ncbi:secondary thiamine-phosphate synthase enzyme YjbQ [Pyruvatibacter sp.]|uniref:secondary thiamine-phosphate synthase enzyme YjbQ n=1 Tax=Pyruvatibacter sp. TaxID=1981328 RepID=UPI0032EE38B9